jgi:hypothetical protein
MKKWKFAAIIFSTLLIGIFVGLLIGRWIVYQSRSKDLRQILRWGIYGETLTKGASFPQHILACEEIGHELCADVVVGQGGLMQCLLKHQDRLGDTCKNQLNEFTPPKPSENENAEK